MLSVLFLVVVVVVVVDKIYENYGKWFTQIKHNMVDYSNIPDKNYFQLYFVANFDETHSEIDRSGPEPQMLPDTAASSSFKT